MADATDRSMPAVAITNVWPTARMTRIAAADSIASMLPRLRNVAFIDSPLWIPLS